MFKGMETINLKEVNVSTILIGNHSEILNHPLDIMEKLYFWF